MDKLYIVIIVYDMHVMHIIKILITAAVPVYHVGTSWVYLKMIVNTFVPHTTILEK
jgi:hypothetical protein